MADKKPKPDGQGRENQEGPAEVPRNTEELAADDQNLTVVLSDVLEKSTNTPAVIDFDFERVQQALILELKKYDIVVTADGVKDAKTLAAELNKIKKVIADYRKKAIAEASEPIRQDEARFKGLEKMIDDGRVSIVDQVAKYEDKVKAEAVAAATEFRNDLWEDEKIDQEFRRAAVDDMGLVSNLTTKGFLTAKAKDQIRQRVSEDRRLQDQTRNRLTNLELESHRADLSSPLTREHVEAFLFVDDEQYAQRLKRLIEAEIQREAAAKDRERERLERAEAERKRRAAAEELRKKQQEELAQQEKQQSLETEAKAPVNPVSVGYNSLTTERDYTPRTAAQNSNQAPNNTTTTKPDSVVVAAQFRLTVPAGTTDETIKAHLIEAFEKAGIKSDKLVGITVTHNDY